MSCLTSAQRGAIQCWTPADLEPYREYPALDLHLNLFATAQLYQLSPNSNCPDIPQSLWMNAKSLLKRILHQKTFYRPDLILDSNGQRILKPPKFENFGLKIC